MKIEKWNVEKVIQASKIDSFLEIQMGDRIIQFTNPYRESLKRFANEEAMLKHRKEWEEHNGFSIFNTKGEWLAFGVTDCRTQEKRKNEKVDDFLMRTVHKIGNRESIEAAVQMAVEYRLNK